MTIENKRIANNYYDIGNIPVLEFIEAKLLPAEYLGFLKGTAMRYYGRAPFKEDPTKDYKKAADYARWITEYIEKHPEAVTPVEMVGRCEVCANAQVFFSETIHGSLSYLICEISQSITDSKHKCAYFTTRQKSENSGIIKKIDGLDKIRTVYLSGPITNDPNYFEKFREAEEDFLNKGFDVFNPTNIPKSLDYEDQMDICLKVLEKCDAVFMMAEWRESNGARREYQLAKELGKMVFFKEHKHCTTCEYFKPSGSLSGSNGIIGTKRTCTKEDAEGRNDEKFSLMACMDYEEKEREPSHG